MCRTTLFVYVCKHEGTEIFKCKEVGKKEKESQTVLDPGDCDLGLNKNAGAFALSRQKFCPDCTTNPQNRPKRTTEQIKLDEDKRAEDKEELVQKLAQAQYTAPGTLMQNDELTKEFSGSADEEAKLFEGRKKLNEDYDKATEPVWRYLQEDNRDMIGELEKAGEKWSYFIDFYREDESPAR
ncbi:hypothetical protein SBOR_10045 [Sclerotinia borealis F-4128]|uniref:Uncharacterized protein n=1 Tax=Sclerotinia borealis (strain F-4128) TaxID=1432307 RepID=W9C4R9_SCLBF|nr:hypothetical protein SBOR_10045 [Sclerotinia borealis F-4128]